MRKYIILFIVCGFHHWVALGQLEKAKLPLTINHEFFFEDSPSMSADKSTMIFVSNKYKNPMIADSLYDSPFNGIFISKRHYTGEFQPAEPINAINSHFVVSKVINAPSISPDGNMILFSGVEKYSKTGEDIFYSVRIKDTWSEPQNIGFEINSEGYDGAPSISADGKKIFFVREIPFRKIGEQQCYKIWFSERESINDKWERPIQLPYPINQGCENFPRIHSDGRTLFFSSIRGDGKVDYDIYKSVLQDDESWSTPVNLKFLNTKKADTYVALNPCGNLLYFAWEGDIYSSTVPQEYKMQNILTFQGFVTDSLTSAPLATQIIVKNRDNPNETIAVFESNASDGRYTALLSPDKKYDFYLKMDDYYPKRISVSQEGLNFCEVINTDIRLKPFPKPVPATSVMTNTPTFKITTKQQRLESIKAKQ